MIRLPPLNEATTVRVTREGGLAYLPGLAQPRSFQLGECTQELRQQIGDALQSAVPHAQQPPGATVSGGDQRFFRVEVLVRSAGEQQDIFVSFEVPEAEAPEALVHLWKEAGRS